MLQSMHERAQSWVSVLIVASISILFALWGISYYLTPNLSGTHVVAEVNGDPIQVDLYQKNLEHATQMLGLDEPTEALKKEVLQQLIHRALFIQLAREEQFAQSDEQTEASILNIPAFQNEDGAFSQEKFEMILRKLGLTTSRLKAEIAENLMMMQLEQGMQATTLVLPHELNAYIRMALQTRDLKYLSLPFESFSPDVVSEASLLAYYQEHHADLMSEDKIVVEYVVLDRDEIAREERLEREAAQKVFQERGEKMAELAFENPSSLQPMIDMLHLKLQESGPLYQEAAKNEGVFRAQDVMNMVLSEVVLAQDNSGLIPLSETSVMVVHQKSFDSAHELSFEEARSRMIESLNYQSSVEKARKFLEQLQFAQHQKKIEEVSALLQEKNMIWKQETHVSRSDTRLPVAVSRGLFKIPSHHLHTWNVRADQEQLYLLELLKVEDPTPAEIEKNKPLFQAGLSMLKVQMFLSDQIRQKEQHADIQIHF